MMNFFRPCFYIAGWLIAISGFLMLFPAIVDLYFLYFLASDSYKSDWHIFFTISIIIITFGVILIILYSDKYERLTKKQGFFLLPFSWICMIMVGTLPFVFGQSQLGFVNALFETVSGITTTGATILVGLDDMSRGILLWRSILNWIGGIGIIIVGISVLPILKIGGMQLFKLESSDASEKSMSSVVEIAKSILFLYLGLTILCFLLYNFFGMSFFDAISHSFTTVSNGGYSTSDQSIGKFYENNYIIFTCIFFMFICAFPFSILIRFVTKDWAILLKNEQTRFFIFYSFCIILLVFIFATNQGEKNFNFTKDVIFNTVSLITGTGYAISDYNDWGNKVVGILFCAMIIGGCAGSASCGLKIFRLHVSILSLLNFFRKIYYPNGIFIIRYNNNELSENIINSVIGFFIIYFSSFAFICVLVSFSGLDLHTSIVATAATIANVGPAFGDIIGPANNYLSLPILTKLILCFSMLLGRLEIYTILVLLNVNFWKKI